MTVHWQPSLEVHGCCPPSTQCSECSAALGRNQCWASGRCCSKARSDLTHPIERLVGQPRPGRCLLDDEWVSAGAAGPCSHRPMPVVAALLPPLTGCLLPPEAPPVWPSRAWASSAIFPSRPAKMSAILMTAQSPFERSGLIRRCHCDQAGAEGSRAGDIQRQDMTALNAWFDCIIRRCLEPGCSS